MSVEKLSCSEACKNHPPNGKKTVEESIEELLRSFRRPASCQVVALSTSLSQSRSFKTGRSFSSERIK